MKRYKYIILTLFIIVTTNLHSQNVVPLGGFAESNGEVIYYSIDQVNGNTYPLLTSPPAGLFQSNFSIGGDYTFNDSTFVSINYPNPTINNELFGFDIPTFYNDNASFLSSFDTIGTPSGIVEINNNYYVFQGNLMFRIFPGPGFTNNSSPITIPINSNDPSFTYTAFDTSAILIADSNNFALITLPFGGSQTFQPLLGENQLFRNSITNKIYSIQNFSNGLFFLNDINAFSGNNITVDTLPACDSCTTYNYLKYSKTVDELNNRLIIVREDINSGSISYRILTIDLNNGALVYDAELPFRIDNIHYTSTSDGLVFPGDANADKKVFIDDILPIGLRFLTTIQPRQPSNDIAWYGQPAFLTGDTLPDGTDIVHADCNGNGLIHADDTLAIIQNYNAIHNSNKTSNGTNCDYPLYFILPNQPINEGDTIKIGVGLDISSQQDSLYGIAFSVRYDNRFIKDTSGSLYANFNNSWLGSFNSDLLAFDVPQPLDSRMDIGLTRTDRSARQGSGQLVEIVVVIDDNLGAKNNELLNMLLQFDNVTMVDEEGFTLDGCGGDTTLAIDLGTSIHQLQNEHNLNIYPNPTKSKLQFSADELIKKVELYDVSGRLIIESLANSKSIHIETNHVTEGVYISKIYFQKGFVTKKVFILD